MDDFNKQIQQIRNERARRNNEIWKDKEEKGEDVYLDYKIWCNTKARIDWKNNADVFGQWLKDNNISLTFYQRRYLAEKYFGARFTYDSNNQKWEIKR